MLSPSTEAFDRSSKFEDYRQIESLEEYIFISQEIVQVECRRRVRDSETERWETEIYRWGDRVTFQSVELEVAIEELYRGVNLQSIDRPS